MITFNNGQLTLSFDKAMIGRNGPGSGHEDGLRIQIYWPYFKIKNYKPGKEDWQCAHKELFISANTRFRIVLDPGYYGIGGEILGFGLGIDYQKQKLNNE